MSRPTTPFTHGAVRAAEPDMLSIRSGRLYVEDVPASDLVERFGSPLFAFSEAQLRTNVRRFAAAMAAEWPDGPVDVLPALKACPMLATRRILTEEGAGADIYSPGELEGALRAGVAPELLSVNGGGKESGHLRRCIEAGVRITVEDVDEIDLIQAEAEALGITAKIRFRIKPVLPALWRPTDFSQLAAPIDLGIQVYKSGIPQEYLAEMGRRVFAMSHVELVGLHLHVGRHHPTAWYWDGVMREFGRCIVELSRAWGGWLPAEIDAGGGFPSARDPMNKETPRSEYLVTAASYPLMVGLRGLGARLYHRILGKALPMFLSAPKATSPAPIEELVSAAIRALRAELAAGGVPTAGVRLQMEPGRWLYGNTAVHLTRVKKVKRQTQPLPYTWVLTDTTEFFLAGGALEHNRYPIVAADRADAPLTLTADVVGHSCFADMIGPATPLPELEPGDVLAFLETGAYQESSASNFNALARPASVLVDGEGVDLIKRAETTEDVWARDVVPPRLQGRES